jgi:competence protein ComFC
MEIRKQQTKISSLFHSIHNTVIDTLFPVHCLACQENDEWLCQECARKIFPKTDQVCPICEKNNTPDGRVCFSCGDKSPLAALLVTATYQNEILARAIQLLKYRFIEDLAPILGKILLQALQQSDLPLPDLIIPVPLHRWRLRWRGFNQAELLAAYLENNLSPGFPIPIETKIIRRSKFTFPQMKIKNYRQRQKNIRGVFAIEKNSQNLIQDKRILLIDDVATTGATIFECARVLKSAGAREVFAAVLGRQASSTF